MQKGRSISSYLFAFATPKSRKKLTINKNTPMQPSDFFAQPDHIQPLPAWMRAALWTTAIMNMLGAMTFVPVLPIDRTWLGLPPVAHPLYLWIIAEFVFIMGLGYGYCAWANRAPRIFIAVGALGKLAFFVTMSAGWLIGDLPLKTALMTSGDLIFGCLFVVWLFQSYINPKRS